jgi:hypothetical protein
MSTGYKHALERGRCFRHTSLEINLHQPIGHRPRRKPFSRAFADHRVTLLPIAARACHLNGLHARLAPGSNLRDEVGNLVGIGVALSLGHE